MPETRNAIRRFKARETTRLCEIVGLVGYALSGLPGERLLNRLGIKRSDYTVLRRVKTRSPGASQSIVRVLSVDDRRYSTGRRQTLLSSTEEAFRSILTLLSQVSSTAPFHSSVSNHEEIAKRQEAGRLDMVASTSGFHFLAQFANTLTAI
jgi:hypothetical protein